MHQLLHLYLLQTSNSTFVFKLWEGSCTGSLNNPPADLADMFKDEASGRLCLSLWKNKAVQAFLSNSTSN